MKYCPDWKKYGREEIWLMKKEGYTFHRIGNVRMFRPEMIQGGAFWGWRFGNEQAYDVPDPFEMSNETFEKKIKAQAVYENKIRDFSKQFKLKQEVV